MSKRRRGPELTLHRRAKTLVFLLVFALAAAPASGAPPDVTIQIADVDNEGNRGEWADLEVLWDEIPVAEAPEHHPFDDDARQDWYIPFDGEFLHFSFGRPRIGSYAIRWCYGEPSAEKPWSPIEECTIVGPEPSGDEKDPPDPISIARVLHVILGSPPPDETGAEYFFSSIQAAIDAARDGDIVTVHEGRYVENIRFKGKAITLCSENPEDPAVVSGTIIDGGEEGSTVAFDSGEGEDSVISGFTITNGRADWGGGIHCNPWTNPTIRNNQIVGNTALQGGGGVYCGGSATISRNIIASNRSEFVGGGIFTDYSSSPVIASNLIVKNKAAGSGGGIFCAPFCTSRIINNTIADNIAPVVGGGLCCDVMAIPQIWNCIFWGNGDDIFGWGGSYCCVEDTGSENEGEGNIHRAPLFVNPALRDYHLLASSPCIGRSTTLAPCVPAFDLDGEPVPYHAFVDMGADEFVDEDSDTLPDFWERKWFGGLTEGAEDDSDFDKLTNAVELPAGTDPGNPDTDGDGCFDGVEFFAETDPLDPDSFFKILRFSSSGAQVTLRWTTVPGRWYQAYGSHDLQSWTPISPALKSSGDFLGYTLPPTRSIPDRFFRVQVSP